MALIVEDGTGKANADSYISVADASAYHESRGNAAWAALADDTVREQLLRKATDFMLERYRLRWKGSRRFTTQALDWPRVDVVREDTASGYRLPYVNPDEIPVEIGRACAILALRASTEDLNPDLERGVKSEQIGSLRVDYDTDSPQAKRWMSVEQMLRPYLARNSGMVKLVRT